MRTSTLLATGLAALVAVVSLPARAQPGGGPRDELVRPGPGKSREFRKDNDRREVNRERFIERHEYFNARGPAFRPGLRVPPMFMHPSYVVIDYRLHHLPRPPRGHQWIQIGPDYVLVSIGTGLIVQIVLGF